MSDLTRSIREAEAADGVNNDDCEAAYSACQTSNGDASERLILSPPNVAGDGSQRARDGCSEDKTRALITSQLKGHFYHVEEGLLTTLEQCLRSDNREFTSAALSGYVDHFQTLGEDALWGCGWRNIQMLCSFLMAEVPEAREVLFNGVGFVPDIPSLQRWLEIAWQKGFDQSGAEYYDWKIYRTRKWIGTTECAALLRAFGIRINIVSFKAIEDRLSNLDGAGVPRLLSGSVEDVSEKGNKRSITKRPIPSKEPRSAGISCHECGRCTLSSFRYRGLGNEQYDLCSECMIKRKKRPASSSYEGLHTVPVDGAQSVTQGQLESNKVLQKCMNKPSHEVRNIVVSGQSYDGTSQKHSIVVGRSGGEHHSTVKHRSSGSGVNSFSRGVQCMESPTEGVQHNSMSTGEGSEQDACHLAVESADHRHLIEWVWKYFTGETLQKSSSGSFHHQQPIIKSERSPLYFQHRGHSRTIVGIELRRKLRDVTEDCEVFLLVLDPLQSTNVLAKTLRDKTGWKKLVEQDVHALVHSEYQICYADRGIARGEELEELKVLTSLNYTYFSDVNSG
ncbi:zinc finger-containing ubiquitin peptidase 1 [Marchantia polymorpha subsp. ruderalis]|uniref:ZZ-type domain-containing protein n=2 Tax=Marchantia polymorpha TaxID=3197 RepID=A0AAF6B6B9_MARPO|nr:hypothetical protein MARPO_0044s0025 [Marchantia polymorpha]BBN07553.1 hypothetical protein Mp_4g04480 [Marchantia polymorpha subsp. ruderalis]|eukprot:PTQ39546.1 hypothetical protein MARPO_0044s0025 [Marchantia polymorpha]